MQAQACNALAAGNGAAELDAATRGAAGSVAVMDGTRIVMVRHGESVAQERRIVGGQRRQGLAAAGRAQVEALRDRLAATGGWTARSCCTPA